MPVPVMRTRAARCRWPARGAVLLVHRKRRDAMPTPALRVCAEPRPELLLGVTGGSTSAAGCSMSPRASHRLLPRRRSRSSAGWRSSTPPRSRCSTKCRSVRGSPTLLVGRQRVENFGAPGQSSRRQPPRRRKKCLLRGSTAGDALTNMTAKTQVGFCVGLVIGVCVAFEPNVVPSVRRAHLNTSAALLE